MFLTITICTWNRSSILDITLDNLTRINFPPDVEIEIILVNNNCTDDTENIVNKFTNKLPIKKVYESKPGLSNARNAAIRQATGEYIIWTDDDILFDKEWLTAYVDAFKKHPESAVFGGPIEPKLEGTPPAWLKNNWRLLSEAYGEIDFGDHEQKLAVEGRFLPYGANYAVKTSVQKNYLYDPSLGLCAGKIILDEETKVLSDILNDGFHGWWVPEAKVKHLVPNSRQSLDFLESYYVGYGKTLLRRENYKNIKTVYGYPRWALRKYLSLLIQYSFMKYVTPSKIWTNKFKEVCKYKGIIIEYKHNNANISH